MKESESENTCNVDTENDENEEESNRREGSVPEQAQTPISHVQPCELSTEPRSLESHMDSPEAGADVATYFKTFCY